MLRGYGRVRGAARRAADMPRRSPVGTATHQAPTEIETGGSRDRRGGPDD